MHKRSEANETSSQPPLRNMTQCCSGFCIDLLEKFSDDLGFTYELIRVEDPKFGVHVVSNLSERMPHSSLERQKSESSKQSGNH